MTPRRIRLSRRRGWRLAEVSTNPNGAVSVARPSRWANPYRIERRDTPNGLSVSWAVTHNGQVVRWPETRLDAHSQAVELFEDHRLPLLRKNGSLTALAGKDLACWCADGEPCHAVSLLVAANPDVDPAVWEVPA